MYGGKLCSLETRDIRSAFAFVQASPLFFHLPHPCDHLLILPGQQVVVRLEFLLSRVWGQDNRSLDCVFCLVLLCLRHTDGLPLRLAVRAADHADVGAIGGAASDVVDVVVDRFF